MTPSQSNPNPTTKALATILLSVEAMRTTTADLHEAQQNADEHYDSRTDAGRAQDRDIIEQRRRAYNAAWRVYHDAIEFLAYKNGNTFGDVVELRDMIRDL